MDPVVLIGAGGHAKVILEIFEDAGQFDIAGITAPAGVELLGRPVLGDDAVLPRLYQHGIRHAFIALGDNRLRQAKAQEVARLGFRLVNAISPRAAVSRRITLGCGVAVMPGAAINVLTRLGDGVIVNTGAVIDHDCRLGPFCHVAPGSALAGCVSIGEGAFLGTGCRVIPRIVIGDWAVVGAGAVVISDLPAAVTAVGVPADIIKSPGDKPR